MSFTDEQQDYFELHAAVVPNDEEEDDFYEPEGDVDSSAEEDDDSEPQTADALSIHAMIQHGLTEKVIEALDNGVDPNAKDEEGQTLLCMAISCGNEDVLRKLLQLGADITINRFEGGIRAPSRTLIPISITLFLVTLQFRLPPGVLGVFKFAILSIPVEICIWSILISANIFPDKRILWSITTIYFPLFLVSRLLGSRIQNIALTILYSRTFFAYLSRRLLLFAVNITTAPPPSQLSHSPGANAVSALVEYEGDAENMMLLLLQAGLDLGSPQLKGGPFRAVWMWAIERGYAQIAFILSGSGVPPSLFVRSDGPEPVDILPHVALNGYLSLLHFLLNSHNYEPEDKDDALLACLSKVGMDIDTRAAIATRLLQDGANASITRNEGRSALSRACEYAGSHLQLLPLLLQYGAGDTVNSVDMNGQTALHHAAWRNGEESKISIDLLLTAGADINTLDHSGHTPLWEAASKAVPSVVTHLLQRGAIVDLRSPESTTPLMEACVHNSVIVVAILLADGANAAASVPDNTPLVSALTNQYLDTKEDLISMLLLAGAPTVLPPPFPLHKQPLVKCIHCTRNEKNWLEELLTSAQAIGPIPPEILTCAIQKSFEASPFIYLDGLLALLQAGGDPSAASVMPWEVEGGTVMHFVARSEPHNRGDAREVLRFLVNSPFLSRSGSDLLLDRDKVGRTPLPAAAQAINQPVVEELLSLATSFVLPDYLNIGDSQGYSPLAVACQSKPTSRTGYTPLGSHPDLVG